MKMGIRRPWNTGNASRLGSMERGSAVLCSAGQRLALILREYIDILRVNATFD